MNQALSFALFRTYAVPSIGGLLARTGEFTERTQKRYDDTVLILDAVLEHGFGSSRGPGRDPPDEPDARRLPDQQRRPALRAVHVRRRADPLARRLRLAPVHRDREGRQRELLPRLGRHMDIKAIPATYQDFTALADAYEREHFGFDEGGRAVAESTLSCWPRSRRTTGSRPRWSGGFLRADGRPAAGRVRVPAPARCSVRWCGPG